MAGSIFIRRFFIIVFHPLLSTSGSYLLPHTISLRNQNMSSCCTRESPGGLRENQKRGQSGEPASAL